MEFSPDLFAHRSFTYYQWCGIRCTPRFEKVWHAEIDNYLHDSGFVTPTTETRWFFVKGFAPGLRGWSGSAKYLCQSLGCWSGDDYWVQWSIQNPDAAKALWPTVVDWSRQEKHNELYMLLRSFDREAACTPDEVKSNIKMIEQMHQH